MIRGGGDIIRKPYFKCTLRYVIDKAIDRMSCVINEQFYEGLKKYLAAVELGNDFSSSIILH